MKIYFAGSIRGGRQDALLYKDIIAHLGAQGTVLTEHIGSETLTEAGEALSTQEIHDRDMQWILSSDVLVAEVTQPSLGVGYEIGRAIEQGKHVLCLYREQEGKLLSAMIEGSSALVVKQYKTLAEAKRIIDEYFRTLHKKKVLTLVFALRGQEILLGLKKRGFGTGRWNGFGGKVSAGETIEFAARRELQEEAGLGTTHLEKRGVITFIFENDPTHLEVHIFSTKNFTGELIESDEMKPEWFSFDAIPYESMWPDDKIWLPLFLAGKNVCGECYFKDGNTITYHTIKVVE